MKDWKLNALVKAVLVSIIAGITTLLGGWDDVMQILTVLVVLDFLSGWIRAIVQKQLSSDESFRGVAKKVLIFMIVMVAAQVDRLAETAVARELAIMFYCATEGLSIVENCVAAGIPVPSFLRDILKKLNGAKFGE